MFKTGLALLLLSLLLAGCGSSGPSPSSPAAYTQGQPGVAAPAPTDCSLYITGHDVTFSVEGVGADAICQKYILLEAGAGQLWSENAPNAANLTTASVCKLTSDTAHGNGMIEVDTYTLPQTTAIADTGSDLLADPIAQQVCEQFVATGSWTQ